ncbi:hypothetical protein FORC53_1620 [Vibrio vulnificus]|uniref:Uncharacterized protein n=1 Tax=Vibrio vulnificus TaxID=672 RepID=A0AAN1PP80_VIBVL|nr:hypothetical protein FORC53_1620 [Vibrio vulnificus]
MPYFQAPRVVCHRRGVFLTIDGHRHGLTVFNVVVVPLMVSGSSLSAALMMSSPAIAW